MARGHGSSAPQRVRLHGIGGTVSTALNRWPARGASTGTEQVKAGIDFGTQRQFATGRGRVIAQDIVGLGLQVDGEHQPGGARPRQGMVDIDVIRPGPGCQQASQYPVQSDG